MVLSVWPAQPERQGGRQLAVRTQEAAHWLVLAGQQVSLEPVPDPGDEPGCAAELTEVLMGGEAWWTLGFEATGPPDLIRSELEATAAFVFAWAMPGGMELGMNDSWSYAERLRRRPG